MNDKELRKGILRLFYNKGFKFLARDKDNRLYVYTKRPKKKDEYWDSVGILERLKFSDELFADIKFGDKEPLDIAKALGVVDWSKVPKDTKVLVSDGGKYWSNRYFKEYQENSEKPFIVYAEGATSWSATTDGFVAGYRYCKLAESEE